ncbi:tripartite tricarboxylate transporter substrate binding protein [Brachybacterium sp. J144]|uniref:tripartite tricarboxylate transporter substrate binding protein n=1 Tax=Brachybacterium sp. J144 TaxID=3116487 RepID=UPI002E7981D5|nr:tripartite tricarboxylate transporter substrate binding protein [Brachybacterium sp. J144]MEE1650277.1 tripartite tricarboxylate transporter substrate binding protein [Brachybacterium sp. J144]
MSRHSSARSPRPARRLMTGLASAAALALLATGCSEGGGGEGSVAADAIQACNDINADYPAGPVELVVPWAAGGGTDGVARLIGDQLSGQLGTNVNVVNRTGGSGVVGHQAMVDAAPDGQTIGLVTVEIGMMHHQGLTEISGEDLTAISQMNEDGAGITVAADADWQNAEELLAYIEANPGEVTASGTGQGGIWHLALLGMLLDNGLPVDAVNFVPSEGAAPALQELAAGGIDMTTNALGESKTMLDSGRARAIGVMGTERDPAFPDVETLQEQLGSDYSMSVWRGIAGPVGLDPTVVEELECHLGLIAESEEFNEFMTDSGLGVKYAGAEDFQTLMREDDILKGEVMEEAGLAK